MAARLRPNFGLRSFSKKVGPIDKTTAFNDADSLITSLFGKSVKTRTPVSPVVPAPAHHQDAIGNPRQVQVELSQPLHQDILSLGRIGIGGFEEGQLALCSLILLRKKGIIG